jgi:hypothetical protein
MNDFDRPSPATWIACAILFLFAGVAAQKGGSDAAGSCLLAFSVLCCWGFDGERLGN